MSTCGRLVPAGVAIALAVAAGLCTWVCAAWADGGCNESCDGIADIPVAYSLGVALPNPTRSTTNIAYDVPWPGSRVNIKIFDITGALTATLIDEFKEPGRYFAVWDGRTYGGLRAAPGVYFLQMEGGRFRESMKLILTK